MGAHPVTATALASLLLAAATDVVGLMPFAWRWVPIGGGGAIMTVEASPHRPGLLLAGCDVGGVMRSEDFGRHWRISNRGLVTDGDRAVADFLFDPHTPGRVYMASGCCFGQPKGNYGGLWRSDDGGRSWTLISHQVRFSGFGSYRQWGNVLKLDQRDASIWAGTAWDGLMRSADGGKTWQRLGLAGKFIVGVEIGPGQPRAIYVAVLPTRYSPGGVFVSRDEGHTWREALAGEKVRSIAADPQTPGRVSAVVRDKGLMLSEDFGKTWRLSVAGIEGYLEKQWANAVAVDPHDPATVYLATCERVGAVPQWWRWRHPDLFVSRDRGLTWRPLISAGTAGGPDAFDLGAYLARVDAAGWWKPAGWFGFNPMGWAIDPLDRRRIYIHDWFGVWASDDRGQHWRAAMDGLAVTCVRDLVVSPVRKGEAYIGMADVAFFRTPDAGRTVEHWEMSYPASNCTNLALEARGGEELLYSATGRTLYVSRDRGQTWHKLSELPANIKGTLGPATLDAHKPGVVYCGRFYTDDAGRTWHEFTGMPGRFNGRTVSDPSARGRLYSWSRGQVLLSDDGGKTWRDISNGIPFVHPGQRRINALTINPKTGRVLVGCDVYGVLASDDQGKSWRTVLPHYYVTALDAHRDGRTVAAAAWVPWYAAAKFKPGVFVSRDGGETWRRVDSELGPVPRPSKILIDPTVVSRIWLGTGGNGVFIGEFAE